MTESCRSTSGWTVGPSGGLLIGQVKEIVYDTGSVPNSNDYLSLLTWDLIPVMTVGVDARWQSPNAFLLDFNLITAIPNLKTGSMWDYDWLTVNDPVPTYWSKSDVFLRWGFRFNAAAGYRVFERNRITAALKIAYHLDWWSWTDIIRDSNYGLTEGLNGIVYSVAYHIPQFILDIGLQGRYFYGRVSGGIGPVIAMSHDHHKLRTEPVDYPTNSLPPNSDGLHFYDRAFGGPWLDIYLTIGIRTSGPALELKGGYQWLNETRGYSSTVYTDGVTNDMYYPNAAGFAFYSFSFDFLVRWDV